MVKTTDNGDGTYTHEIEASDAYMGLLAYAQASTSQALRDDFDALTSQRVAALNDWAIVQARRGMDVIEDEIETGIKRMRPLRPDDV